MHLQAKERVRLLKARIEVGKSSSSMPSEGSRPCWHLDSRLLASTTVTQYTSIVFELPHLWQFIMQCQGTGTENFPYPAHSPTVLTTPVVSSLFTSDPCGFPFFKLSFVFLIFWLLAHIQHFSSCIIREMSCHFNSLSAPHCWPSGLLGTQGKMTFPNIPRKNASH